MKAGWKIVWLSAVVLAISFGAERLLVPDVVPVGYANEPQASWAVLTAFVLRAIELTAAWVGAIALVLMLGFLGESVARSLRGPAGYLASHATGRLSSPRKAQPPIFTGSDGSSRRFFSRPNRDGKATSATIAREAKAPAQ
jgi:hypothetical protein